MDECDMWQTMLNIGQTNNVHKFILNFTLQVTQIFWMIYKMKMKMKKNKKKKNTRSLIL